MEAHLGFGKDKDGKPIYRWEEIVRQEGESFCYAPDAAHESKPATYIIRWEDGVTKPMKATVVEKHLLPQD